jgi:hypothetical protein
MRKLPIVSGAMVAAALVVAACGGTASPTVAPVVVPSVAIPTIPAVVVPSIAIPTVPAIGATFAIPSFTIPSFAIPSFTSNADPALGAAFPTTIGGQPVTGVKTYLYIEFLNAFESDHPERILAFQQAMTSIGADPSKVSLGIAQATVNENPVNISAIRTPGVDANKLIAILPALAAAGGSDQSPPTISQTNIGGKNVTVVTDPDGNATYAYVSGDTAWTTASDDPATVAAIFAALP